MAGLLCTPWIIHASPPPPEKLTPRQAVDGGGIAATNLSSTGAVHLERTLENLLNQVFFNLINQSLKAHVDAHLSGEIGIKREIFDKGMGKFLVVDRFQLGPSYLHPILAGFGGILGFGADASFTIHDIYPRQAATLTRPPPEEGWLQWSSREWFGLLPVLAAVLPPSFEPAELEHPFHPVTVAGLFPLDRTRFEAMPSGHIRSYALKGGISFPGQLFPRLAAQLTQALGLASPIKADFLPNLILDGTHHIHVLKKAADHAWIGISTRRRSGPTTNVQLGHALMLFRNTFPWFLGAQGLRLPFDPLRVQWENLTVTNQDLAFSCDMAREEGRRAFFLAAHGDFTSAVQLADSDSTAVQWLVHQTSELNQGTKQLAADVSLYRASTSQALQLGVRQNKLKNDVSRQFSLEHRHHTYRWNLLTGNNERQLSALLAIPLPPSGAPASPATPSARLLIEFASDHRLASMDDFIEALQAAELLMDEPLQALLPPIPAAPADMFSERMVPPWLEASSLHTLPVVLGRLNVRVSLSFDPSLLRTVLEAKPARVDHIWKSLQLTHPFLLPEPDQDVTEQFVGLKESRSPQELAEALKVYLSSGAALLRCALLAKLGPSDQLARSFQVRGTSSPAATPQAQQFINTVDGFSIKRGPEPRQSHDFSAPVTPLDQITGRTLPADSRPPLRIERLTAQVSTIEGSPSEDPPSFKVTVRLSVDQSSNGAHPVQFAVRLIHRSKGVLGSQLLGFRHYELRGLVEPEKWTRPHTRQFTLALESSDPAWLNPLTRTTLEVNQTYEVRIAASIDGLTWSNEVSTTFSTDATPTSAPNLP